MIFSTLVVRQEEERLFERRLTENCVLHACSNMEIHHHYRKRSKKQRTLREYLFEFAVIFVVIVGSYIAENIREHAVNKHKEKEYIASLLHDLVSDSTGISSSIAINRNQVKGLDSLLMIMNERLESNELRLFYYLDMKYTTNYNDFIPNTSTLNVLMKAGGLDSLEDKGIASQIVNYDFLLSRISKQTDLLKSRFLDIMDQQAKLIDFRAFFKPGQASALKKILEMSNFPPLISTDRVKLNAFYFDILTLKGAIIGYIQRLEDLMSKNSQLVKLIQDSY